MITQHQWLSWGLGSLCLIAPFTYQSSGGLAERFLMIFTVGLTIIGLSLLTRTHAMIKTGRGRRREIIMGSPITIWLAGGYLTFIGGLISLIPIPIEELTQLASRNGEIWREAFKVAQLEGQTLQEGVESTLSLSPAHSWRWCGQQLAWLLIAYLSSLTRGERSIILWSLAALGPLLSLIGGVHFLLEWTEPYGIIRMLDQTQKTGLVTPIINHNHLASIVNLSIFVSLGLYKMEPRPRPRRLILSGLLLSVGLLVCTESRAAQGITLSLALIWLFNNQISWKWTCRSLVLTSLLWSVGIPFALVTFGDRLLSSISPDDLVKVSTWRDTLSMMIDFSLWGVGRGAFGEVFTAYQSFVTSGWVSQPEQIILLHGVEGGLLGLIGGVILPCIAGVVWWRSPSLSTHPLAQGLALGVLSVALQQSYDFGLEYFSVSLPVAVAWGVMWSYQREPEKDAESLSIAQAKKVKRARNIVLLLCILHCGLIIKHAVHSPEQLRVLAKEMSPLEDLDVRQLLSHPSSAHLSILYSHYRLQKNKGDGLTFEWVQHTRRLAPTWSGPHVLEARLYARTGLDELAALSYRRALLDRQRRDEVFADLIANPLSVKPFSWLPQQYWIAWYKHAYKDDPSEALQTLRSARTSELMVSSSLRALWFRHLGASCHLDQLEELQGALKVKKAEINEEGSEIRAKEEVSLVDIELAQALILICNGEYNQSAQLLNMNALSEKISTKDGRERKKMMKNILSKMLKSK